MITTTVPKSSNYVSEEEAPPQSMSTDPRTERVGRSKPPVQSPVQPSVKLPVKPPVKPPSKEETMSNKELRINPPKVFDGNQDNFIPFVQDARVYLSLNDKSYNTNQKKIIYVLSFINEGTAKTWKEAFLDSIFSDKNQDYGKFTDFLLNIKGEFSTADSEGEAQAQLRRILAG